MLPVVFEPLDCPSCGTGGIRVFSSRSMHMFPCFIDCLDSAVFFFLSALSCDSVVGGPSERPRPRNFRKVWTMLLDNYLSRTSHILDTGAVAFIYFLPLWLPSRSVVGGP
ncbi:hypothetical protein BV22DRAFT_557158 [Leucogyrophana mollusca]|uniref:Uncharacterized protein n=1 Tax=Leucogyrophana mollusca TaxID=85980 RepID=A0ACB8BDC4_9AGAM|nr:hypothetical protein BV22DRAFT_557158 [Leucogyrophana mollusca]